MLLSESAEKIQNIVNNIPVFATETDETRTAIYNYMISNFGGKTLSPFAENNTYNIINNMLTLLHSKEWTNLKSVIDSSVSPESTTDTVTETTDTDIYGFNDDTGVNDSTVTRTITTEKEHSDIYENFQNSVDFYKQFSYYYHVIVDIVSELTLAIYE